MTVRAHSCHQEKRPSAATLPPVFHHSLFLPPSLFSHLPPSVLSFASLPASVSCSLSSRTPSTSPPPLIWLSAPLGKQPFLPPKAAPCFSALVPLLRETDTAFDLVYRWSRSPSLSRPRPPLKDVPPRASLPLCSSTFLFTLAALVGSLPRLYPRQDPLLCRWRPSEYESFHVLLSPFLLDNFPSLSRWSSAHRYLNINICPLLPLEPTVDPGALYIYINKCWPLCGGLGLAVWELVLSF